MQEPIGRNRYDGLNIAYRKRMSNHFSINTNYVLSRAVGYNGSSASFGNAPTDLLNIFAPHDFGYVTNDERDRKSTRLNSSHQIISYAVFCLKKKSKVNPDA